MDMEARILSIARALNELREWCLQPDNVLGIDALDQVPNATEGMADLSFFFINEGLEDPVFTIHNFTHLCTRRLGDLGPACFTQAPWADFLLIDPVSRDLTCEAYALLALDQTIETANAKQLLGGELEGRFAEEMRRMFMDDPLIRSRVAPEYRERLRPTNSQP